MAKRILVPLDGTDEAETGVPLIADAARGSGAVVRLLRVVPMPENICDLDGHIVAYADQEGARLEAAAFGADLIAMTARQTCSLTRLVLGTTADQVTRRADVPVVLYRAAPRRA